MRRKGLWVALTLGMVLMTGGLSARAGERSPQQLFEQANAWYREGKFEQAKDAYEALLKQGMESGNVYYNLGNAYFKLGKLGQALVRYERAKRLIPNDSDLKANLDYLYSQRENPVSAVPQAGLLRAVGFLGGLFSFNQLTGLVLALYYLVAVMAGFMILTRVVSGWLKAGMALSSVILMVAAITWLSVSAEIRLHRYAIITAPKTECRFAPAENAIVYFQLYEGTKVEIVANQAQWVRIKTPDRKLAWVKSEFLETI